VAKQLPPVFLDTSIQVALVVHGPGTKARIRQRLDQHGRAVTGLVCRQEFKRRLLHEADYLLRLLDRYRSFDEVRQHLIRFQPQYKKHVRKKNISLQILEAVHEASDEERTERARLYLRSLLLAGLTRFDQMVDEVREESGCGCARQGVREKAGAGRYDLGQTHCGRLEQGACQVVAFLRSHDDVRRRILAHLRRLPAEKKSAELKSAEAFLQRVERDPEKAPAEDPCLKVGDLLIALESVGTEHFYTLNSTESQHLCRAVGQTLIVRPVNPLEDDIVCRKDEATWPEFGHKGSTGDEGPTGESTSGQG
jgi:hypothetical protein